MTILNILYSGLGGHSAVVFSLIEADELKRFDYVLIFYGIEDMPPSYINRCKELGVRFYFVKKRSGFDKASQKKIIQILKDNSPHVILLHSINLILPVYTYRLFNKTRIISVEHQSNHLKTKKERLWSALLMFLSDKIVYLTESYKNEMEKQLGYLFISRKVTVINNGINIKLFRPLVTEGLPAEKEVIKIGMLSRLTGIKDHPTLIEAFQLLLKKIPQSNILLEIAGDGETRDNLIRMTDEMGLSEQVHFLGMIPENESALFLNSQTIYIHASFGETMSTSVMQAMACGKAIVASDVAGINNMISNGDTGILIPVLDKELLADKIKLLLEDHLLRKRLGKNASEYAGLHFGNNLMFEAYSKLFPNP